MKTTLFAVLVAMMGSSIAVNLTDISSEGEQINASSAQGSVNSEEDDSDNYADGFAETSTNGHAVSHGTSVMSNGNSDVYIYAETNEDDGDANA